MYKSYILITNYSKHFYYNDYNVYLEFEFLSKIINIYYNILGNENEKKKY